MKTFVINLDRATERMAHMRRELGRIGLDFERLSAITPETMPEQLGERFTADRQPLMPTERACYASHLRAAEMLLESAAPMALILEDDIAFDCSAADLRALGRAAARFDVLVIGGRVKRPCHSVGHAGAFSLVYHTRVPLGTMAYFLSRAGAAKLLDLSRGVAIPIDALIRKEAFVSLDVAGVSPTPVLLEACGVSMIDPDRHRARLRRSDHRRYRYATRHRLRPLLAVLGRLRRFGLRTLIAMRLASLWRRLTLSRAERKRRDPVII